MRIRAVRNPDLKSRHRGNVDGFSLLKLLDILLAGNSHMTTMLNKNKNKKPETRQSPFKARHDAVSGFLVGLDKSSIPNRTNRNSPYLKCLANFLQFAYPTSMLSLAIFNLRTLWLFTVKEHHTIVLPWTACGLFGALSGGALTTNQSPDFWVIFNRLPLVLLWIWVHVLVFTVANQRLPNSVVEDSINKSWRPLPSGRITGVQARRLLLGLVPVTMALARLLGAGEFSLLSLILTWLYNDLEGADENYIIRNLINTLGLICWSAGTTMVACGKDSCQLNAMGYYWLKIEAAIVFTTLQVQDLRDQKGDQARGRRTAPIVLGDVVTRWTIAIPVGIWSLFCPYLWDLGFYGFIVPAVLGGALSLRVLRWRTVEADQLTWRIWGLWIGSLFILPLWKNPTVLNQLF